MIFKPERPSFAAPSQDRPQHSQHTQSVYDSLSDVPESRVWWRADFQSGSRVLKKVF